MNVPQSLDRNNAADVRAYILEWHNANKTTPAPRDWPSSWGLYLTQLRKHKLMRDYCDGEHGVGQYCLVCDENVSSLSG